MIVQGAYSQTDTGSSSSTSSTSSSSSAPDSVLVELRSKRVGELRTWLSQRGLTCEHCSEKEHLLELAIANWNAPIASATDDDTPTSIPSRSSYSTSKEYSQLASHHSSPSSSSSSSSESESESESDSSSYSTEAHTTRKTFGATWGEIARKECFHEARTKFPEFSESDIERRCFVFGGIIFEKTTDFVESMLPSTGHTEMELLLSSMRQPYNRNGIRNVRILAREILKLPTGITASQRKAIEDATQTRVGLSKWMLDTAMEQIGTTKPPPGPKTEL